MGIRRRDRLQPGPTPDPKTHHPPEQSHFPAPSRSSKVPLRVPHVALAGVKCVTVSMPVLLSAARTMVFLATRRPVHVPCVMLVSALVLVLVPPITSSRADSRAGCSFVSALESSCSLFFVLLPMSTCRQNVPRSFYNLEHARYYR